MTLKQKSKLLELSATTVGLARAHFLFVAVYVVAIVASDAWGLIMPEIVLRRWTIAAIALIISAVVWYTARNMVGSPFYYKSLIFVLILTDIVVAAVSVYSQRGMASRSVMLFAIPIAVSAALRTRAAIFATATIATAAYTLAAVRYFVLNFNEGYKAELYTETLFYCGMFFVLAAILWVVVRSRQ